jgi:serine/threonine protein phosphatase PrpC
VTEIGDRNSGRTLTLSGDDGTSVTLAWAAITDVGRKRQNNEDSYIVNPPVFAVADGMGGHMAGDLASAAVVTRLGEQAGTATGSTSIIEQSLVAASDDIAIVAGESEIGVGTTVTGAVLTEVDGKPFFAVFNIGDSRVYRFEGNELTQVTTDHSLVQELVDSGLISKAQAYQHPEGNIITRAIGFDERPIPDYTLIPVRAGLRLLICSDGLTGELRDDRLQLHVAAGLSAHETASALVDAALAAGGRDNVTVLIVDVVEGPDIDDTDDTAPDGRFGIR